MIQPTIASREVTRHILKAFDIHMSKKLGQNFLIDAGVVADIVAAAAIDPGETVLEIGPGIGTLTQGLAEAGANVIAVEIDKRLLDVLAKTLAGYDNVKVVCGDILQIDILALTGNKPFKVVANLPYYITTPIIMTLLERDLPLVKLVTMVQREVAERMAAQPGKKDYGALSVAVQYYTEPVPISVVGPSSFIPEPAVESVVIACDVRREPPVAVDDQKMFFRVVKAAFAQRRKTLNNTLKLLGVPVPQVKAALAAASIDGGRRGETLSLSEFAALANAFTAFR